MNTTFPSLKEFTFYKKKDDVEIDGVFFPEFEAVFYRRKDDTDRVESIGIYTMQGKSIFAAWGYLDQEHCSFHAVYDQKKNCWKKGVIGCPRLERDSETGKINLYDNGWRSLIVI